MRIAARFLFAVVFLSLLALRAAANGPPAFSTLCDEIAGEDGNVRRQAAQALGRSENPEAVEVLLTAYRKETGDSTGVKAECAAALGAIGTPQAVTALGEMLKDPDYWVRKRAAESLGNISGERSKEALKPALGDEDPRVRAAALISAGILKDRPALFVARLDDPDPRVAAAALEGLFRSGASETRDVLSKALSSEDPSIRFRAAALGATAGDARAGEILGEGMRSETGGGHAVREAARAGCAAVKFLASCAVDEDCSSRDQAFAAIEKQTGCKQSIEFFLEVAGGTGYPSPRRVRAASAVFDRKQDLTEAQVGGAARLLDEKDPDLVAVSLQILLERGGPSSLAKVIPMAGHENTVVRHFAIANLAKFGSHKEEEVLAKALGDTNGANIRMALEGLGRLGTRASIPAVKRLLEDRILRRYAQETLDAIETR